MGRSRPCYEVFWDLVRAAAQVKEYIRGALRAMDRCNISGVSREELRSIIKSGDPNVRGDKEDI